jgi:hypothetical protein
MNTNDSIAVVEVRAIPTASLSFEPVVAMYGWRVAGSHEE